MTSSTVVLLISLIVSSWSSGRSLAAPTGSQLLSRHDTVAVFAGPRQHTCLGLTSLCPDRCGHSGTLAVFTIQHYLAYEKPGQYGDPRQTEYLVLIKDNQNNPKLPLELITLLEGLKKGDRVRLVWQHNYITKDGSSFPDRTITDLKKLTDAEADRLIADSKAKPQDKGSK